MQPILVLNGGGLPQMHRFGERQVQVRSLIEIGLGVINEQMRCNKARSDQPACQRSGRAAQSGSSDHADANCAAVLNASGLEPPVRSDDAFRSNVGV